MEMKMYKTKDLYEASLFYAKEVPLLQLEWIDNKCFFIFENKKATCEELSQKFWNGNITVNCLDYVMAIKRLKDRLFAQRDTTHK
jgi:hypothetical protein